MIDTKKVREDAAEIVTNPESMTLVVDLCDEVDRLRADRDDVAALITHAQEQAAKAEAHAQALTEALCEIAETLKANNLGASHSAESTARALLANPDASAERLYSEEEIEKAVVVARTERNGSVTGDVLATHVLNALKAARGAR